MKKIKIFLVAIVLIIINTDVSAQTYYWNDGSGAPTSITTSTTGNCSVGGSLYLQGGLLNMTLPTDGLGSWRTIQGGTVNGGLNILANTGSTDGPTISLHGTSYPSSDRNGSIMYNSIGTSGNGHRFLSFDGTSFHTNMTIGNDGHTIIGLDVDYSFIQPGDNLTVRDQLGLWPSWTSAGNVTINGNTGQGALTINAHTSSANGASLLLRGGSIGGYMQYIASSGFSPGVSHQFTSTDGTTYTDNLIIGNDGRTIIGPQVNYSYIQPGDNLTVRDQIGLWPSWTSAAVVKINGNTSTGAFLLNETTSQTDGASIGMYGAPGGGIIKYISHDYGSGTGMGHIFMSSDGSSTNGHMIVYNSGKVAIGPDLMTWPPVGSPDPVHPDGYLLYVETGILTEKLKVANHGDTYWSDYVFNKNYKLMPLNKVENYVKENKHLPEIPSAADVAKDGIDVESMDAKLLQKIEELTLYVIQQQKEIDELKEQIKN